MKLRPGQFGKKYFSSGRAYKNYKKYVEEWTSRVARKIHMLTKHIEQPKILDIGCAHGYLLSSLKKTYGMKVTGLEYSAFAYEKRLKIVSREIKYGDIMSAKFKASSFDVVICFDVFEYLSHKDNITAAKKLVTWSKDLILFTNPYKNSINSSQIQNPDPQRLTAFTKKEYINIFNSAGANLHSHYDGWHGGDILIFKKR
jgi:2-polyprenyl-3-methyl-5-hydroxy-6-metoxy-1,4-benzoquinol methylase